MDSEYHTCGTCNHGSLYDQCSKCEDEHEATRSKLVQPSGTKLDRFLGMVRVWVERDDGDMEAALTWMYQDSAKPVQPLKFARLIEMELKETK